MMGNEIIKKVGKICSIKHLSDSHNKRQLCVDVGDLKINVVVGVKYLSSLSDEELIGKTATIQCIEDNGRIKFPVLLKVDDIFYKGKLNKS